MKIINIVHCMFSTFVLIFSLNAQVKVKSVKAVLLEERGLVNNPVWSRDSRSIAFEFIGNRNNTEVLVFQLHSNISAKPLLERKDSNKDNSRTLIQAAKETSSRLPLWSNSEKKTLYFLFDQYKPRFIGKIDRLSFNRIPMSLTRVESLYSSIAQHSGVSEYHSISVEDVDYLFIKQKDSPGTIHYTDQYSDLYLLPGLDKWIDTDEDISSFSLTKDASRMIICKGLDKDKIFVLGEVSIDEDELYSIAFNTFSVPKSEDGVLQEPTFSPANKYIIAYLEMVLNSERENVYQLFLQTLDSNHNMFLTDKLYRNENNKTSRPNSTSYVWHPNGKYIFFVNTDEKRKIAYVDMNNLSNPKIRILKSDIEFAEQLAISPNGKYLAVMTQIASETDNTDALGQLFIVELKL